jgi:energy-coupling factor transporter ATP-binding protein EcfA2
MLLKLKNFKSWEEAEFEFADTGLTLLSGPSGSGKTSILQAIYFALYGVGNKVTRHGNTSCRVEFTFGSLNIVRTKRPNRVVLTCPEGMFEDGPAQAILNRMFGKNFDTVSYVEQDDSRNLLTMTPGSRLEFLESFAFENVDIEKLKENLKEEIKKRETKVTAAKSKLETCKIVLEKTPIPSHVIKPSVEEGDISKLSAEVTALEQRISCKELEMRKNIEERKKMELATRELASVNQSIEDIGYVGDEKFCELRKQLEKLEMSEEISKLIIERKTLREEYDSTLAAETEMYNQRVEEAGRKMWSRLQESNATELLRCLENRAERSEERKACTQRLVELEDDYLKYLSELPKAGTVTKCPSCSCSVTVVTTSEGSNIFLGSDVDEKAKNIVRKLTPAYKEYVKTKSRLEDLNEDIPLIFEGEIGCGSVTSPEWTLQSLQKYIRENVQAEAVYKTPFQPSGTLVALKKKVAEAEACKGRFSLLKAETTCVVDEVAIGEVRHAVLVEENKRVVYIPLAKKKSDIEKVLENKNLEFGELNFEKLKSDLVDARTALTTAFEAKILWDEYRTYVDAMERRSSAEHVVKEANELFFKSDSELQTAIKLKAIILEAESASLESVVSTFHMPAPTFL